MSWLRHKPLVLHRKTLRLPLNLGSLPTVIWRRSTKRTAIRGRHHPSTPIESAIAHRTSIEILPWLLIGDAFTARPPTNTLRIPFNNALRVIECREFTRMAVGAEIVRAVDMTVGIRLIDC